MDPPAAPTPSLSQSERQHSRRYRPRRTSSASNHTSPYLKDEMKILSPTSTSPTTATANTATAKSPPRRKGQAESNDNGNVATSNHQESSANTNTNNSSSNEQQQHDYGDNSSSSNQSDEVHALPRMISVTVPKRPGQPAGLTLQFRVPAGSSLVSKNNGDSSALSAKSKLDVSDRSGSSKPPSSSSSHSAACCVAVTAISLQSPFHPMNTNSSPNNSLLKINDEILLINSHRVSNPKRAAQMIKSTTSGSLTIVASRGKKMEGCHYKLARVGGLSWNPYVLESRWKEHKVDEDAESRCSKWRNDEKKDGNDGSSPPSRISNKLERGLSQDGSNTNCCGVVFESGNANNNNNLVKVASVKSRCPFSKTGLKAGDVVLTVDGTVVTCAQEAERILASVTSNSKKKHKKEEQDDKGRVVALLVYSFWDMRFEVLQEKLQLESKDDSINNSGHGDQLWQVSWSYEQQYEFQSEEFVILRIPHTTVTFQLDFDANGTCSCNEPFKALDSIPPEELEEHKRRLSHYDHNDNDDDDHDDSKSESATCVSESASKHSIDEARAALELLFRKHIQPAIDALNFRTWKQVRLLAEALRAASEEAKANSAKEEVRNDGNLKANVGEDAGRERETEGKTNLNRSESERHERKTTKREESFNRSESERHFGKSEVTEIDYFSLAPSEPKQGAPSGQKQRRRERGYSLSSSQPRNQLAARTSSELSEEQQSKSTMSRRSVEPPGVKQSRRKSRSRSSQPRSNSGSPQVHQSRKQSRSPQPYQTIAVSTSDSPEENRQRGRPKSRSPQPYQSAAVVVASEQSSEMNKQRRNENDERSPQPYQSADLDERQTRKRNDRSPQPYGSSAPDVATSETVEEEILSRRLSERLARRLSQQSVGSTFEERRQRRASERSSLLKNTKDNSINNPTTTVSSDKSSSTEQRKRRGLLLEPVNDDDDEKAKAAQDVDFFQEQLGKLDLNPLHRGLSQKNIEPSHKMYNVRSSLQKAASERVASERNSSELKTSSMIPMVNGEAIDPNDSFRSLVDNKNDANNALATTAPNRRPPNRLRRRPSVIPAHFDKRASHRISELTVFSEEAKEEDESSSVGSGTSTTSSDDSESSSDDDSEESDSEDEEEPSRKVQKQPQQRQLPPKESSQSSRKPKQSQRQLKLKPEQASHSSRRVSRRQLVPKEPLHSSQIVLYDPDVATGPGDKQLATAPTTTSTELIVPQQPPQPPPPMIKPLPRRIKMRNGDIRAKYKVAQHIIGTGAFGTVRSCTNRKTHEKFAVKSILKKGNAKNSTLLKNEIALVQRIHHQNVVRVVDVIQDKEYIHIVMEECKGGDLFDKIVDGGIKLTEERACEIVGSLMDAMAYLHGRNIVHRDLKAEHIMLSNNDVNTSPVKIIDFGLAIIHNASIDPPMTAFAGSAFTVAPEVIKRSYGIECDLWSVGVIAYFLLTQKMPFNASTDKEIFQKITSGNYAYPQWTQTGLSEEAKDFIDRLLVVDPKRRLTAKQALNHLWIRKHNHARLGASMNSGELAMVPAHERAIVPARPPPARARMSRDPSSRNGMTRQHVQPQQPRQQRQHPQESHGGDRNVATARKAPKRSPRPSQARNGSAPHARPASSRRLHHEPAGRVA